MRANFWLIAGIAVLAAGILFTLQGAGIVRWPAESFMIDTRDWIERGILVAILGIGMIVASWRIRRG